MKMIVYKGFDVQFLKKLSDPPLLKSDIEKKKNVLEFDKNYRKQLNMELLYLKDPDVVWITYEEYTLIKVQIDEAITEDGLQLIVYRNNLYPDYYPIDFSVSVELAEEIKGVVNAEHDRGQSEACQKFLNVYNSLVIVNERLFGSFYNYEYEAAGVKIIDFFPQNINIENVLAESDFDLFLNEDVDTYLRDLLRIEKLGAKTVSLQTTDGESASRILKSFKAYCQHFGIRIIKYQFSLPEESKLEEELIDIAKNEIRIENFDGFRAIKFYKNPDVGRETIELSQNQIIQEIIHQAENAYDDSTGNTFRDIFITASTGAGKSVMFQIPAVYLARKHNKLTIIIEPVKALMQDQKEKLNRAGFTRVEAFNSDLITQVEKEAVLQRIKDGEVDLLYLSPETLLSYSIETIIGDREIGLLIVDEAHIVTTWGVGFRPDYWYLGSYINRLRNQIQTKKGIKQKVYHFPICAFTATAINGGLDDSVSDTIISLYMENPIKYLGYVRRDDISFVIDHPGTGEKLPKSEYDEQKCRSLDERIKVWLENEEKTIVYFPFASLANDAAKGFRSFAGLTGDKRIATYTGRNIEELSNQAFAETKKRTFDRFKSGETLIMYATKAFGMGVDVNDVKNVYHFAVSGNLSDYVQEIGRAARKATMKGFAIADCYYNDLSFMRTLFGMSRIRQYQVKKVLEGIYETYLNKKGARSFLISPESFTFIFNGKDEGDSISKLKTCLLMLEKDFYDKYNFKVLVSRPQSVFTKTFICINREEEKRVLNSEYGQYMTFICKGRLQETQPDGTVLSDNGDIYRIDLESIWEKFHPNISFPQFKYWYFNSNSQSKEKVEIMPSIRNYIAPRQKITVDARGELLLIELREKILQDFDFIADTLYAEFKRQFFSAEDFAKLLREKYGIAKARIIANSLFDLVDPDGRCVKRRNRSEGTGKGVYSLSNGNFKEYMRRPIMRSKIMHNLEQTGNQTTYIGYVSLLNDTNSNLALKLLSIFDYINYEVVGGEEPEIFIRLNDPNKVRNIVMGNMPYSNSYVSRAQQKHDRDVAVLQHFFNKLNSDKERWDFIEDYFLGIDVLGGQVFSEKNTVKMSRAVDKEHSFQTTGHRTWGEIEPYFDASDRFVLSRMAEDQIPIPEYLETTIKKSEEGKNILMSWPTKDVLICHQDTSDHTISYFAKKGWLAYRIYEIDYEKLKDILVDDAMKERIGPREENDNHLKPSAILSFSGDFGMNMKDSSWPEIWKNMQGMAETASEKESVKRMKASAELFNHKEKPFFDCEFVDESDGETYGCDLLWPESKVMLFSEENREAYETAAQSDWSCFLISDKTTTPERLILTLKEA